VVRQPGASEDGYLFWVGNTRSATTHLLRGLSGQIFPPETAEGNKSDTPGLREIPGCGRVSEVQHALRL